MGGKRRSWRGWVLLVAVLAPVKGLPEREPALALVVNIPAFRLDVVKDGTLARSLTVAVGMSRFPTPRGEYEITDVEWNPRWEPPDSPWAAKERPMPPGPDNPMGRVKLNFRPLYFLHGTPFASSLGTAASHGCVRLRNADAVALAREVIDAGAPGLDSATLEAMIADSTHPRQVRLTAPVPISLRYDLVETRADQLLVHADVYHLGPAPGIAEVMRVAAEAGWDTLAIDSTRVRELLGRARRRSAGATSASLRRDAASTPSIPR